MNGKFVTYALAGVSLGLAALLGLTVWRAAKSDMPSREGNWLNAPLPGSAGNPVAAVLPADQIAMIAAAVVALQKNPGAQ